MRCDIAFSDSIANPASDLDFEPCTATSVDADLKNFIVCSVLFAILTSIYCPICGTARQCSHGGNSAFGLPIISVVFRFGQSALS
jgi:hypothetical protein